MDRLQAREPAAPWPVASALLFVAAYVALWIAGLSVVSILSGEIEGSLPSNRTLALSALISGLAIAAGVVQWARARNGPRWMQVLKLVGPSQRNTLLLIFLLSLGLAWAIDLLGVVLRWKGGQVVPPVVGALRDAELTGWIVAAFLAVVVLPLADGLVFSGVLYPAVARIFSDNRIAILMVSLIYMLVSLLLSAAPSQWYALIQPLLMALVVNSTRAYYQSTRAAVLSRAAFGLFFVVAALLSAGFGPAVGG